MIEPRSSLPDQQLFDDTATHGSSVGIPHQNVPTITPVKMRNRMENLTPVTMSGPRYHFISGSTPFCSASNGVASPSSAADDEFETRLSNETSLTCSGIPWESTVLNEGGDETSERKEAVDFLVRSDVDVDVDGMTGGSSSTGNEVARTGEVDVVVE